MTDIVYKQKYNKMLGHMVLAKQEMDSALELHEEIEWCPTDSVEQAIYRGVLIKQVVFQLDKIYQEYMKEFDIVEMLRKYE